MSVLEMNVNERDFSCDILTIYNKNTLKDIIQHKKQCFIHKIRPLTYSCCSFNKMHIFICSINLHVTNSTAFFLLYVQIIRSVCNIVNG